MIPQNRLGRCGALFPSVTAIALAMLLELPVTAQEPRTGQETTSLAALRNQIANHIAQPRFARATWGIKILSLDTGQTLFAHNAGQLFSPASNSKLYTTALGLHRLGADYRIRTSLYAARRPTQTGTLAGDLTVFGRGDPTFNAHRHGGDLAQALEALVAALTNAGLKRVEGDLIADESFFRGPRYGSGWDWDDLQYYYGAEVSALTINDNTLQLSIKPGARVGALCRLAPAPATGYLLFSNRTRTVANGLHRSLTLHHPLAERLVYVIGQMPLDDAGWTEDVTVPDPAAFFAALFREALARHGIRVAGRVRTVNWLDRLAQPPDSRQPVELGAVESPPLRELVREILKPSQNLYADLLLAHVGALCQATNAALAEATAEEAGIRELDRFLTEAGIGRDNVFFEEGSGLSRNNLTTPDATVRLLDFMSRHPWADVYRDALPIAGVDGTLKSRMKGTRAAGNVRAKTGSLRWADSLSGYVTTAAGEHLAFAIMLNRYPRADADPPTRAELDAIAVMLADFSGRSTQDGK